MQSYDPMKLSTYLMYYDVNLYSWTMINHRHFRWVNDVNNFDVMNVTLDSSISYVFEVDLEYPHLRCVLRFTVLSNVRETTRQTREEASHDMIKSVTSYIIAICSNVLVTVYTLQRFVYCNSYTRNLHSLVSTSNSIQILEL